MRAKTQPRLLPIRETQAAAKAVVVVVEEEEEEARARKRITKVALGAEEPRRSLSQRRRPRPDERQRGKLWRQLASWKWRR